MFDRIARLCCIFVTCLALAGCVVPSGPAGGSVVGTAKDKASVVTCRTNRAQVAQQYSIALSGATGAPPSFAAFITELGVKCPSGGTYSWTPSTAKVLCSVHTE